MIFFCHAYGEIDRADILGLTEKLVNAEQKQIDNGDDVSSRNKL